MDSLERDAFEVLKLVQSMKNSFAPINRIPPEVLSLIPDYYCEGAVDRAPTALTHVCRSWREIFTSRSSLWTTLEFTNIDKTRAYIQRSRSSPLDLHLVGDEVIDDAFALVIPHICRLKSLTVRSVALPRVLEHFHRHTPLLEKLDIDVWPTDDPVLDVWPVDNPVLDGALFSGDLSSLRELRLHGDITDLSWKNLANLRSIDIRSYSYGYGTTQLLDFFESAPLLHTALLRCTTLDPPNHPSERVVPLRHLKVFSLSTGSPNSILLRHLHIPIGASLISQFILRGEPSRFLSDLAERYPNFDNLSHITTIHLLLAPDQKFIQLRGPSGSFCVLAWREESGLLPSYATDHEILCSLDNLMLSTIRRLAISDYEHQRPAGAEQCPISQTLSFATNLRTLVITDCNNLPFILALDPQQNPSNIVLCPNLEGLVLYVVSLDQLHVEHLISMAKNRASRGAKLSSITFIDLHGLVPEKEVLELGEYVTHVEYRGDDNDEQPYWYDIPDWREG